MQLNSRGIASGEFDCRGKEVERIVSAKEPPFNRLLADFNMNNPWLSVPANEYDEHMGHHSVRQREFLDSAFKMALDEYEPKSIALLGCATGGGLQLVNARRVERLVAVDINTEFVELVRSRYAKTLPQLELLEADIEACELEYRAFDLVHCALLLEYVDVNVVLKKMARWVSDTGVIVVVLQLAFPDSSPVSDTGCESLKLLKMELHLSLIHI